MELVTTGIGFLLLFAMWRYLLKPSILDTHRDKFFDLRDDLRDTFAENGWDMNSRVYRQLRDLMNGYLLYTEKFAFSEFSYIETSVRRNPSLQQELKRRFEVAFAGTPAEQLKYIHTLRQEARRIMMSHMVLSSFPLVMVTALLFPFVGTYVVLCAAAKGIKEKGLLIFRTVIEGNALLSFFLRLTIARIADVMLEAELVEEYSLRQSVRLPAHA